MSGDKSHVGLETNICPVCGQEHEVGVLLDRRLYKSLEHRNLTGVSMCPEHADLAAKGYIALVGVDEAKSTKDANGNIGLNGAYRTGDLIHMRREVFGKVFNVDMSKVGDMVFVDQEIVALIKAKVPGG